MSAAKAGGRGLCHPSGDRFLLHPFAGSVLRL